jgi:hypothetical protein
MQAAGQDQQQLRTAFSRQPRVQTTPSPFNIRGPNA